MRATYGRSTWFGPAIKAFYVLVAIICYILTCLKCLWARAELQNSQLPCLSFQMENAKFLPGTWHVVPEGITNHPLAMPFMIRS